MKKSGEEKHLLVVGWRGSEVRQRLRVATGMEDVALEHLSAKERNRFIRIAGSEICVDALMSAGTEAFVLKAQDVPVLLANAEKTALLGEVEALDLETEFGRAIAEAIGKVLQGGGAAGEAVVLKVPRRVGEDE